MSMDGPMVNLVILSGVLKYTSLFVYFWMKYIYILTNIHYSHTGSVMMIVGSVSDGDIIGFLKQIRLRSCSIPEWDFQKPHPRL